MNGGRRSEEEGFIEEAVWERLMQGEVWSCVGGGVCVCCSIYAARLAVRTSLCLIGLVVIRV